MIEVEQNLSKSRTQFLMEVASAMALQTQMPEDFESLPGFLASAFNLAGVSVAVVKSVSDGDLILLGSSSQPKAPSFEQDLLDVHHQTRPLSSQNGPVVRASAELQKTNLDSAGFSHSAVFAQSINEKHRLLVIVQQGVGELSTDLTAMLQIVTDRLGKDLGTLIMWMTSPRELGEPFDRLTDREWMVLRGLNSDAGEKQLADQLGLSPHTLHSHIKAIYRKVGVQGRLSLLRRVQKAMHDYRFRRWPAQRIELSEKQPVLAVAIG